MDILKVFLNILRFSLPLVVIGVFSLNLPHAFGQSREWEPSSIPFKLGANYGYGYDTRSKSLVLTGGSCLDVDTSQIYEYGESEDQDFFHTVSTRSDVARQFRVSPKVSLGILKVGSIGGSGDFLKGNEVNQYNISYMAHSYSYEKPKLMYLNAIKLKQKYVDLLLSGDIGKFRNECGDSFIWGFQEGREFKGVLTIDTRDQKKWRDWSGNAGVSADIGIVDFSLSVGHAKKIDQHFGLDSLTIFRSQTDTAQPNITSAEQFVEEYERYDEISDKYAEIGMVPAPYSIAENYPSTEDILDPNLENSGLEAYVNLLWDYKAVIDDARFVLDNPDLFALGVKAKTRNSRINRIKGQEEKWAALFNTIQDEAKHCLDDPEKAKVELDIDCETGAQKFPNPLRQRTVALPHRYQSVCQDLSLPGRVITQGNETTINVHNNVRGDAQMGRGPVRVKANLRIVPEGTQLLANIQIKLLEWKINKKGERRTKGKRDTEFTGEATIPIFDLNNPEQFGIDDRLIGSLQDCIFPGEGIREGDEQGKVDKTSGRDPEGNKKFTGTGLIQSIECDLGGNGSEENALSCKNLKTRGTTVRLVGKTDYLIDGILEDIEDLQAKLDSAEKTLAQCSNWPFKFQVDICERVPTIAIKRLEEELKIHRDEYTRNLRHMQPEASRQFARFKGWPSTPGGFGSSVLFARSAQGVSESLDVRKPETNRPPSSKITLPAMVRKEINRRLVKAGSQYIVMKPKRHVSLDAREQLQRLQDTIN